MVDIRGEKYAICSRYRGKYDKRNTFFMANSNFCGRSANLSEFKKSINPDTILQRIGNARYSQKINIIWKCLYRIIKNTPFLDGVDYHKPIGFVLNILHLGYVSINTLYITFKRDGYFYRSPIKSYVADRLMIHTYNTTKKPFQTNSTGNNPRFKESIKSFQRDITIGARCKREHFGIRSFSQDFTSKSSPFSLNRLDLSRDMFPLFFEQCAQSIIGGTNE
jgi:hypothetical protein